MSLFNVMYAVSINALLLINQSACNKFEVAKTLWDVLIVSPHGIQPGKFRLV